MEKVMFMTALLLAFVAGMCAGMRCGGGDDAGRVVDVVTVRDTVTERLPAAVAARDAGRVSLRVAATAVRAVAAADSAVADSVATAVDTVAVELPVTSREYSGAGYRAWVSGIEPRLDSISIVNETVVATTAGRAGRRQGRLGVGVTLGLGIGPGGKVGPAAAIGITYSLWGL